MVELLLVMSKKQFDLDLRAHLSQCGTNARPFICDGHPLAAEIFIVGFNSATLLDGPFTDFWNVNAGMDLKSFDQLYCAQRQKQQTKTGLLKKPFSPTRQKINKIRTTSARDCRHLQTILGTIDS
jgi:hypothetical protein